MLRLLLEALSHFPRGEEGQAMILGVGVVAVCFGAIMISVDVGGWLRDKGDLQNDGDAIALAAAQELPDQDAAIASGEDAAEANDIDPVLEMVPLDCANGTPRDGPNGGEFCFEDRNGDGRSDLVRVKVSRRSGSFIAATFGVADAQITITTDAADLTAYAACLKPWALKAASDNPTNGYDLNENQRYVLQDLRSNEDGEFAAIAWYGVGEDSEKYKDTIRKDCIKQGDHCATDRQVSAGQTLKECRRPRSASRKAVSALNRRYDNDADRVFCDVGGRPAAFEKARLARCADRAVPIGIVNTLDLTDTQGPGGDPRVTVYGLATFYIAGWNRNGCSTAEANLSDIIDQLQEIIDQANDPAVVDKLEDVVAKLETALSELNKNPPDVPAAIGNIDGAIGDLQAAINDGLIDPAVGQQMIDELEAIKQQLREEDDEEDLSSNCVWGYLLSHTQALPQWQVRWNDPVDPSRNPFTPIGTALVEELN